MTLPCYTIGGQKFDAFQLNDLANDTTFQRLPGGNADRHVMCNHGRWIVVKPRRPRRGTI